MPWLDLALFSLTLSLHVHNNCYFPLKIIYMFFFLFYLLDPYSALPFSFCLRFGEVDYAFLSCSVNTDELQVYIYSWLFISKTLFLLTMSGQSFITNQIACFYAWVCSVSIGCFCAQLLAPWCKEYELCVCIDVTELLSDMLDSRRLDADRGRRNSRLQRRARVSGLKL
ncbi:unnamed protein product [Linum tenue]|uniref:Uncharacterized protein n=1 Tax=Linum tenue TaxID=586396 RepID=A0AAV0HVF1_9ROSI|nr:unnamed protein product [Linum tenue]